MLGAMLLDQVETFNDLRRDLAMEIIESAGNSPIFEFHKVNTRQHVYHLLVAQVPEPERDKIIEKFNDIGIQAIVQYYPLYKYDLFKAYDAEKIRLVNTEKFFNSMISLRFSLTLEKEEIELIKTALTEIPNSIS